MGDIMREDFFVKETNIYDKTEKEKRIELYNEVKESKQRLKAFYENMNFAEGDMIDYYIYQIKAEQAKFDYLMQEVKSKALHENSNN
jgi:hypothetical protein